MDRIYGQFSIPIRTRMACVTTTAYYTGDTTDLLDSLWDTIITNL